MFGISLKTLGTILGVVGGAVTIGSSMVDKKIADAERAKEKEELKQELEEEFDKKYGKGEESD